MKLYYKNPLEAAWMWINFDMKIEGDADYMVIARAIQIDKYRNKKGDLDNFKYYIHQDSLNMLEPRDGDIIERLERGVYTWNSNCMILSLDEKIIQRSGIAFMWPEREMA